MFPRKGDFFSRRTGGVRVGLPARQHPPSSHQPRRKEGGGARPAPQPQRAPSGSPKPTGPGPTPSTLVPQARNATWIPRRRSDKPPPSSFSALTTRRTKSPRSVCSRAGDDRGSVETRSRHAPARRHLGATPPSSRRSPEPTPPTWPPEVRSQGLSAADDPARRHCGTNFATVRPVQARGRRGFRLRRRRQAKCPRPSGGGLSERLLRGVSRSSGRGQGRHDMHLRRVCVDRRPRAQVRPASRRVHRPVRSQAIRSCWAPM